MTDVTVSYDTGITTFYRVTVEVTVDGWVVEAGHAYLYLITNDKSIYGFVEDVFVNEDFRGQGHGRKLMEAIALKARECKCVSILLTSHDSRAVARNLYVSLGFECVTDGFRKTLT